LLFVSIPGLSSFSHIVDMETPKRAPLPTCRVVWRKEILIGVRFI
jgi:hypothetical protein